MCSVSERLAHWAGDFPLTFQIFLASLDLLVSGYNGDGSIFFGLFGQICRSAELELKIEELDKKKTSIL